MEVPRWFQRELARFALESGHPPVNGRPVLLSIWNRRKCRFQVLQRRVLDGRYVECLTIENPDTHAFRPLDGCWGWVRNTLQAFESSHNFRSDADFLHQVLDVPTFNRRVDDKESDDILWDDARQEAEKTIRKHGVDAACQLVGRSGVKQNRVRYAKTLPTASKTVPA